MAYKYNPLLKYNLQKIQQGSGEDTQKKVPKFFASIDEIEIGEIGEYQGQTNENFTRGFFYERKDAVTIIELETTTDYVFSNYLNAYINNELYHQQYYISSDYGLSVTQYMSQSCTIGDNLISVIMFSTDFLKTNFAESYTNWNGTFYIYPYARLNGSSFDYNNKLSIVNNVIYYKGQALEFTQSSRGVSNVYVGMEIETHLLYMWIPLFPGWIAFALDTAKVHAAYTETWSIFKTVDNLAISRLTPSAHVTTNDYEFSDQTPYAQVDTQTDLSRQYFDILAVFADAVLVSSNGWAYDNNGIPFPSSSSLSIVYLKDKHIFLIVSTKADSYELKLYYFYIPQIDRYEYSIGGYDPTFTLVKEYSLQIIYPSAQSFSENNSMPINSRQLINFRTATTTQNGLMSYMNVSQINSILERLSLIKYAYGEWITRSVTQQFDFWQITFPTSISGIVIEYTFELRNVQDNETMFFIAKSFHYDNGYALIVQHFGTITGTPTFEYRGVVRYI